MAAPGNHGNNPGNGGNQPNGGGHQPGQSSGGSGGAYDFADNTDVLQTVIDALTASSTAVQTSIDNIYGLLNGELKTNWYGTVYETFIGRCEFYHPALLELVALLDAFGKLFTQVQSEASTLNTDVATQLNI